MILDRRKLIAGAAASAALVLLPIPVAATTPDPEVAAALEAILQGRSAE